MNKATFPEINIQFSDQSLILLNLCLGIIMFGIALGISPSDFKQIFKHPKSAALGVASQFILLPFFTFLLVLVLEPSPSLALGMVLVAACPGGNVSNFISSLSNANVALSVTLTAIATLICPIFTPLNFDLWAHALPGTEALLTSFQISFIDILKTVILLLVIPLILGMWLRYRFPKTSQKIERPIRILSILILFGFIVVALYNNFETFKSYIYLVFILVLIHNALAFLVGFLTARIGGLPKPDQRTISIETGIQNSGFGLILIFTFFHGNGGMAIVAAWWGIWHIIAGMSLAFIFRQVDKRGIKRSVSQL